MKRVLIIWAALFSAVSFGGASWVNESEGTKGTIGMFCVDRDGNRHDWAPNEKSVKLPDMYSKCVDAVMKDFAARRELENGNNQEAKLRTEEWFMNSYREFIEIGKNLGCTKQLLEDWRERVALESKKEAQGPSDRPERGQKAGH